MQVSFTTNPQDVLTVFKSIDTSKSNINITHHPTLPSILLALVSDSNSRAAILPPTVGWFVLTLESKEEIKLQVMGTNADGYLVFSLLHKDISNHLCVLNQGDCVPLKFHNNTVVTLHYKNNSVDLKMQVDDGQQFYKSIIKFSGQVPKSKIGKGEPVARPLDDKGVNRSYLDHSLVNMLGERAPVSIARTDHTAKTTYPKHSHMDDNVRFICSGIFRFTIFDPNTDVQIYECEVRSGESIQIPVGYSYIEEVLEPGVVFNARTIVHLHYVDTPSPYSKKFINVPVSLGILEK